MRPLLFLLYLITGLSFLQAQQEQSLTSYVNPFIGTGGTGHTFPGATLPHGMVQLSPDTRTEGWESCAGYYYPDKEILGFSHTHLSGTGVPDLGDILILPIVGDPEILRYPNQKPYIKSAIDKASEKAKPGYYSVVLSGSKILSELSCTERVGWHRYTYENLSDAGIFIDLNHRDEVIEADLKITNSREITGYRISKAWAKRQHVYFVMQFSTDISLSTLTSGKNSMVIKPSLRGNRPLIIKVGISAVSIEGARKNLLAESPDWDFDQIVTKANKKWEKELSQIEVKSENKDDMINFYTALYHVHIAPNLFSDVDSMYRAMDDKVYKAVDFTPYTVFSLWDTYRAAHPLFTLIDTKRTKDYIKTMLDHYLKAGHLPVWELDGNETWCMIGYHSVSVIADAYIKGIKDFDKDVALKAMIESANAKRFGIDHYGKNGYLAAEKGGESVSKTLEYAYDDWCIGQFAKAIGNNDVYKTFSERAQNYKNLMDPASGFMRARSNNQFLEPFKATEINMHYTEGNAWHYSFSAVQDLTHFKRYLGGDQRMESKLDELFNTSEKLSGRDQSDVTGLIGQYAHGNEPSHHIAYLYNHTGSPWKTQQLTRKITTELYKTDAENGLCGNEDCGQMSAWYIMSALGMYQISPGNDYFDISAPLFDKITINLESGKKFKINTNGNSHTNSYIQSVTMAGRPLDRSYFLYAEIMNGTPLQFNLGPEPNKSLWTDSGSRSPSEIKDNFIVPLPFINSPQTVFSNTTSFTISDLEGSASLWYTFDKTTLIGSFTKYTKPVMVDQSLTVYYYAKMPDGSISKIVSTEFRKLDPNIKVKAISEYSSQYTAGGNLALIDMVRGGNDYRSLAWQGFEGNDLEFEVDLGEIRSLTEIGLSVLQDQNSWIFFPSEVSIQTSEDGVNYKTYGRTENTIPANKDGLQLQDLMVKGKVQTRYVKVKASSLGKIPAWHPGAGGKAWLFADELILK